MKTPDELSDDLTQAYSDLEQMLTAQHEDDKFLAMAETRHAEQKALLLMTIPAEQLGSNAEKREAALRTHLTSERQSLANAERQQKETRLSVELARLRIEHLRAQLRVLEIAAAYSPITASYYAGKEFVQP